MDSYLQRALDLIEAETRGLSGEQLDQRRDGKWSIAEILEHLALAYRSTIRLLDRSLTGANASVPAPTRSQRVITFVVTGLGYLPRGRQAPEWTRPRGMPPEQSRQAIREALVEMDGKIRECETRFGRARIALHPVIGPLTAQQWRKFHWVHTRHHLRQVRALKGLFAAR